MYRSFIQIVFFLNISMPEDIFFLFEQKGSHHWYDGGLYGQISKHQMTQNYWLILYNQEALLN
jgi:hypothetical protein